jgi:hypothetical protein
VLRVCICLDTCRNVSNAGVDLVFFALLMRIRIGQLKLMHSTG